MSDNVPIATDTLITVVRLLEALSVPFHWGGVELQDYNRAVLNLGRDLINEINARCTARDVPGDAHDDQEWEFMDETVSVAREATIALRDALSHAGVDFD